jgi:maltose 6'-phosphate phosphatase
VVNTTSVFRMKTLISLLVFAIFLATGCTKEQEKRNQKPLLNVTQSADGLTITLHGSSSDPDGTINDVKIYWGDKNTGQIAGNNSADFQVSHVYDEPANFNVMVTLRDNSGDTTSQTVAVSPDFKETSLEGIKPGMFKHSANEYLVMTINLHTYQEDRQNEKLNMIADVIGKMNVDFACFQECAQYKYAPIAEGIIRANNMALIISNSIQEKYQADYHFVWNWSHYGWTIWEEGVAVLSRYPIIESEDRYISANTSTGSITSRKVIYAACQAPGGLFNIFSAHTHWRTSATDEEQNNQVNNIKDMVTEKDSLATDAVSFVCGDFNGNPTSDYPWSEGYNTMMRKGDYTDSFLEIYPDANQQPALNIYNTIGGDLPGRIDYIFLEKNTRFRVVDSQIIFTPDVVGLVSDHFGVLTKVVMID